MAEKTISERVYTAYLTGSEAEFYSNGVRYEFTPEGLASFITAGAGFATETYVDNAVSGLATETYVDNAVSGLATEAYVDGRLSANQRNAINALSPGAGATVDDVITALQSP